MKDWEERLERIQKANRKKSNAHRVFTGANRNPNKTHKSPKTSDRGSVKCDYCGCKVSNRNKQVSEYGQVFCKNCAKWKMGRHRR